MMVEFSLTLTDDSQKVLERLSKGGKIIDAAARALLTKSALIIISVAAQKAPRKKGNLSSSIGPADPKPKKSGDDYSVEVGTNLQYAPAQELGSGIYGTKNAMITPKRAKMLRFVASDGRVVFARAVRGVQPKKFMEAGFKSLQSNVDLAFAEADKIMQTL